MNDDLVVRARRDRVAFGLLYDRYYPQVLRYCVRRLFVRAVAEDVTSEVFLKIARHLPGFRGTTETDFRRWLFGITTNAIHAHLRQARRRQELWQAAAQSRRIGPAAESGVTSIELLDWPAVYLAILELEPREQAIVTLRYFVDLPHDEIAAIVGMQPGAVRTALSRILERLRARFALSESQS